ncbi:MAG TPA: TetR/AcrR family transcriptional regulator, partial [Flavobacterium sp.]|nr:TetR/AcrR family transcriptional regulator [Flavobacterium sp.]
MAAPKNKQEKKQPLDDDQLVNLYMASVLEHNASPKNVYLFCKEKGIDEADFYSFYNSLDALKQDIWVKFFENAIETVHKDASYRSYEARNKLLSFYFTIFEILTLNRSYVYYALKDNKEGLRNLQQLKEFRKHFKDYAGALSAPGEGQNENKVRKAARPVLSEGAWVQFLLILKF